MKRVLAKDLCPCDSGKRYKNCCWNKDFEWVTDKNDVVFKSVKLHPEAKKIMDRQKNEFIEIFGREQGQNEPIMVHTLLMSDEQYYETIEGILREAGVREELIYAHTKTGLTVTEENAESLTDSELKEWKEAVKEYSKLKKAGLLNKRTSIDDLLDSFTKLHYVVGLIIWKRNNLSSEINLEKLLQPSDYTFFCLTKNLKTFRAM